MTKPLLQNHPWSQQFPAHHSQFEESRRGGKLFLLSVLIEFILIIAAIICLALWAITAMTGWLSWDYDAFLTVANYVWIATGVGFIVVMIIHLREANAPIRTQKLYYKLTNTGHLSRAKRQALALDLFSVYDNGFWSETLEHFPQAWRVKGHESKFKLMHIANPDDSRNSLEQWWGITSPETARSTIEQLLQGMHTPIFAKMIKSSPYFVLDTFEKLNFSKEDAINLAHPVFNSTGGYPPQLIWAFDLWRAVSVSRNAFAAQYLTMEEAWDYILRASNLAFEIFPDRESFYNNVYLGRIFWGHDAIVAETIEIIETFKNCDWPQRSLPWNPRGKTPLSMDMQTGFGTISNDTSFFR